MTVSFQQPTYSVIEGTTVEVCAELPLSAEILVSVNLVIGEGSAQLPTDFTLSPSTQRLDFAIGQTQSCATVEAVSDFTLEEDEMFSLTLVSNEPFVLISTTEGSTQVNIPNQDSKI